MECVGGLDPSWTSQTSTHIPRVHECNAHHDYIRLSTACIPQSSSLLKRFGLPLGVTIRPLAMPLQIDPSSPIRFGKAGIVRCRRCRAYVNPFVQFIDGGRRWRCNFCGLTNEVPTEYFCPIDQSGRRSDLRDRPELVTGSVEFTAPAEYMVRPPMPPVYLALVEATDSSVRSGVLKCVLETLRDTLHVLPGSDHSRVKFGIITFSSSLQFFTITGKVENGSLGLRMLVVPDVEDVKHWNSTDDLPAPVGDLVVNLADCMSQIKHLLTFIPSVAQASHGGPCASCLEVALQTALLVLGGTGGKLLVFQTSEPCLSARGKMSGVVGGSRSHLEQQLKKLASEFSRAQVCVDLYALGDSSGIPLQVSSLGMLPKYTGGDVFHIDKFDHSHEEILRSSVIRNLTRETGWEAVMRIRCSRGIKITSFHGHFFIRSADLLALPAVDSDKTFSVQLALEDVQLSSPWAYIQSALLYTSSLGERLIRVQTMAIPVVATMGEVFKYSDAGGCISILARVGIERLSVASVQETRIHMVQKLLIALREYCSIARSQSNNGFSLALPENLKMLPVYMLGLLKHKTFQGPSLVSEDAQSTAALRLMTMSVPGILVSIHPSLYDIGMSKPEIKMANNACQLLPLRYDGLTSARPYLLIDGTGMAKIYFGSAAIDEFSPEFVDMRKEIQLRCGVRKLVSSDMGTFHRIIRNILVFESAKFFVSSSHIIVIMQGDEKSDKLFHDSLVEERHCHSFNDGNNFLPYSYTDFLAYLQESIWKSDF